MPNKRKIAEIEAEYKRLLEEANAEGDTPDESEILIMRVKGSKADEVVAKLQEAGLTLAEAEEVVEEATDDVVEDVEDAESDAEEEVKKPAKKVAKKVAPKVEKLDDPVKDEEPPSTHRFFGGRK